MGCYRYSILLKRGEPRLCRCWTGRKKQEAKADLLACSGMQHPLGNTFSCSLTFTHETRHLKRTWVKTVAGIPRITLTLLIQISPGIWLELICISSQGLIRIRVIGMAAGGKRQRPVSLLNNPGHCPAPPMATHSLPSPVLTPRSLPSPTLLPSARYRVLQSQMRDPAVE